LLHVGSNPGVFPRQKTRKKSTRCVSSFVALRASNKLKKIDLDLKRKANEKIMSRDEVGKDPMRLRWYEVVDQC